MIGTAASGKTTFFKQMQHLYKSEYDETENQNFLRILRNNFYTGLKELVNAVESSGNKVSKANKKNAKFFQEFSNVEGAISEEVIQQARDLWVDEEVQKVWEQRDSLPNFTIINFDYMMKNVDRFAQNDAVPKHEDVVRCRQRTTGLSDITFPYEKYYFHVFDIGWQKPERKKWDYIAETYKPTAVLYFASLVDWDIPLLTGDEGKSRLDESLEVWEECLNKDCFQNTTMILCLNKMDLFEDKIERVDLKETYPKFKGGAGDEKLERAKDFILQLYMRSAHKTRHSKENIYHHFTCAIDTNLIGNVFENISQEIIWSRIKPLVAE